jgi:uncharacterized protein (UPF0371 family)
MISSADTGFDSKRYFELQVNELQKRASRVGTLYLEVGGVFSDHLAARLLPGFDADCKGKILHAAGAHEVLYCISGEKVDQGYVKRFRSKTYEDFALEEVAAINATHPVLAVVITKDTFSEKTLALEKKIEQLGLSVVHMGCIPGYPHHVEKAVEGLGAVRTLKPNAKIVPIIGAGSYCGKFAASMAFLYADLNAGRNAGYAKLETFPVWDLPIEHPLNLAVEAAAAHKPDVNVLDPHFKDGISATSYARELENFPILQAITHRFGSPVYKSPTEMSINNVGSCITSQEVILQVSRKVIAEHHETFSRWAEETPELHKAVERINQILALMPS